MHKGIYSCKYGVIIGCPVDQCDVYQEENLLSEQGWPIAFGLQSWHLLAVFYNIFFEIGLIRNSLYALTVIAY